MFEFDADGGVTLKMTAEQCTELVGILASYLNKVKPEDETKFEKELDLFVFEDDDEDEGEEKEAEAGRS